MREGYISIVGDKGETLVACWDGEDEQYFIVARCRDEVNARVMVEQLNKEAKETTLGMVEEFHEAFNIRENNRVGINGMNPATVKFLQQISSSVLELGKQVHKIALGNAEIDNNVDNMGRRMSPDALMRAQLMIEELGEVLEAMSRCFNNPGATADLLQELADLRYVVDGTVRVFGMSGVYVDAIKEVHRANMSKLGADGKPVIDGAGRVVKSDMFVKADVGGLL